MDDSLSTPIDTNDSRWFRTVADSTYDWESWHGPDGRLLWVNPAVERVTGYTVAECLAMADYPLPMVAPDDRDSLKRVLDDARHAKPGEVLDFRCQTRDGEERWMSLAWQTMSDEAGTNLGYRTSIRDVTERHKLREELRLYANHLEQLVQERTIRLRQMEQRQRQMEKLAALGQLAAGVAHEINNPLAGMRNAFELIKSSLSPDHKHYELLDLIDREIERISAITHQMYQLYRRSPQQPSPFSLSRVIGEVTYLLKPQADKQGVELQWHGGEDTLEVELAEGEVKQILFNLVRNALQASPAGSVVTLCTVDRPTEIEVAIEDYGAGIPADIVSRIFDPFFTTKQTGRESGMGLGLSVSRSLIESMGGRIEVKSEVGQGSIFKAIFPRKIEA